MFNLRMPELSKEMDAPMRLICKVFVMCAFYQINRYARVNTSTSETEKPLY